MGIKKRNEVITAIQNYYLRVDLSIALRVNRDDIGQKCHIYKKCTLTACFLTY